MQQFFFRPATGQPDQLYRSSSSRPSSDVPSGQKLPRLASKGDWGDSFAKRSWFIVHYGGRLQVEDAFTCCNSRYLYCAVQSRICNYRSHNITKVCVVSLKPLTPEKWDMLECSYGGNGNCSCRTTSWTTIRISHGKWGRSRHSLCTMYTMGIGLPDILGFRECHNAQAVFMWALPSQVAQADDFGDSDFAGYQAPRLTIDNCQKVTFLDQYFVDVAFWCILIYIYI